MPHDPLGAIETLRAQQAARLTQPTAGTGGVAIDGTRNDERLGFERAYQQELARKRAEEAMERAWLDDEIRFDELAEKFARLIEAARDYAEKSAIRRLNQAMQIKPPAVPVAEGVRELQALLAAQNLPVDVPFDSDGTTFVSVRGVPHTGAVQSDDNEMLPGNYEVIGQSRGYRDVRLILQVRADQTRPEVIVRCTAPAE